MSADALTWLREVLDAMTPGPWEKFHALGSPFLVGLDEDDVPTVTIARFLSTREMDADGIDALRDLAPAMLAVIEAAHRFRSMVHVELHNLDDLSELGNRAEALDNAIAACLAAVREEQQRHG